MSVFAFLALVGVGLAAGFLAGLIGIGGGVLMVPFLYFFYGSGVWSGVEVAPSLAPIVAHATSLCIIVPTAALGAWSHHRAGLVVWRVAIPIAVGAMVAAVFGARLAPALPGEALKLGFGVVLVAAGLQLIFGRRVESGTAERRVGLAVTVPVGMAVGLLSALMGVGGGLVGVPLLVYVVRLDLHRVAATSLAVVAFAAAAGAGTYMVSGAGVLGRPEGSVGYVHLWAALPLAIGALAAVRVGTAVNWRMPTQRLRSIFAIFFMLMGVNLIVDNLRSIL
ncbi:MAG TPA: sulfite exporter TauE/SafE family protein [Longimicrobiales bacterium]|nr:sulfite exporter TauE/SafE family protein [Longimicrobiales bacterium]